MPGFLYGILSSMRTGIPSTKAAFVEKASARHGLRFDYSQFEYVTARTSSIIRCSVHGEFTQSPEKHLRAKHACPKCWADERRAQRLGKAPVCKRDAVTQAEYLRRFQAKHGGKFTLDFSTYLGLTQGTVTLLCPEHGCSTYVPQALLSSVSACRTCGDAKRAASKTQPYENFLAAARARHGDKYSYPAANAEAYKNRKSSVIVVCATHGAFSKNAQKHLSGQGCWRCRIEDLVAAGKLTGYSSKFFEDNPEAADAPATLYYLKVGSAYKVGITTNLHNRLKSIKSLSGREVELLDAVELTLKQAYEQEQAILTQHKEHRTYRRWTTEVFSKDVMAGRLPRRGGN
ncbi:GIY-YIG nuclease family protein [Burkholderia multivorans]|nr:GIY-YIG nuclease family protein [Burkholderia multivorans]